MNEYRHFRGRGRGNYQHGNNYRNQLGNNIYGSDIRRCNPNHFSPLLPFPPFRETRPRWQRPPQHNNWRGSSAPLPPRLYPYVRPYSPTNAQKAQSRPLSPLPGSEEARQKAIAEASARIKQQLNLAEGDGSYEEECNNTDESQSNLSDDCIILNELPLQGANMLGNSKSQDKKRKHRKSVNNTATIEELRKKILTQFTYMSKGKIQNLVNNPGSTRYDNALQHLVRDMRLHLSSELRNMYTNRDADPTNEHNKMIDHFNSIVPDLGIELVSLPDTMVAELSKMLQLDVNNEIEAGAHSNEHNENVLVEPEDMFKQAEKLLSSTEFLNVPFDSIINSHHDNDEGSSGFLEMDGRNVEAQRESCVSARSLQSNSNNSGSGASDMTVYNCPPPNVNTIISNSNQFHGSGAPPLEYQQNIRFDEDTLVYDNNFFYSQQFANEQENFNNSNLIPFADSCVPVVPIVPLETVEMSKQTNSKQFDGLTLPQVDREEKQQPLPYQLPLPQQQQQPLPYQLPLPQQHLLQLSQQQQPIPYQPPLPYQLPLPQQQQLLLQQSLPYQSPLAQPQLSQQQPPIPAQPPIPTQPPIPEQPPMPEPPPAPQQPPAPKKQAIPHKKLLSQKISLPQKLSLPRKQELPHKQPLPQDKPQKRPVPQKQSKKEDIFSTSPTNTTTINKKVLKKNSTEKENLNLNIPLPENPKNCETPENTKNPENPKKPEGPGKPEGPENLKGPGALERPEKPAEPEDLEESSNTATTKSVVLLRDTLVREDSSPFSKKIQQDPIYENAFKINLCSANKSSQSVRKKESECPVNNSKSKNKNRNKKNVFNFESMWVASKVSQPHKSTISAELSDVSGDQTSLALKADTSNNKLNVTSFLQDVITDNLLDLPKDKPSEQQQQHQSDFMDKRNKFICEASCESSKSLTDRNDENVVRPFSRTRSHSPYDLNQYSEDKWKMAKSRLSLDERIKEMMKIQDSRVKPKEQVSAAPNQNDVNEKVAAAAAAAAKVHLLKSRKKHERKILMLKRKQHLEKQKRAERERKKEIERMKKNEKEKKKKKEINALKEILKRQQKELEKASKQGKISETQSKSNKVDAKRVEQVNVVNVVNKNTNSSIVVEQNDDTTSITSNLLNLTAVKCNLNSSLSATSKIPIKLISKAKSKAVKTEPEIIPINTVTIKEEPISEEESSSSSSENETETSADNLSDKNNIIHNLPKDILNPPKNTKNIRHFENIDSDLNITNKILETPMKNFKIIVETTPVNISQELNTAGNTTTLNENEESQKNAEDTTNLESSSSNSKDNNCDIIAETTNHSTCLENDNEASVEINKEITNQIQLESVNEEIGIKDIVNENKCNEEIIETTTKDAEEENKCCDEKHNENNKTSDDNNKTKDDNNKTNEENNKTYEENIRTSDDNNKTSEENKTNEESIKTSDGNNKTNEESTKTSDDNNKTSDDNNKTNEENNKTNDENNKTSDDNTKTNDDNNKSNEETIKTTDENNKTSDKKSSDNKKCEASSSSHKKPNTSSSSSSKKVEDSKKHRHGSVDRKKDESSSKTSKVYKKSDSSSSKHKTSDTKTSSSSSSHHHHSHHQHHHSDHQSSSSSISSSKQKTINRLLDIDLQIQKLMQEKWNLYKELNITNIEQLLSDNDTNTNSVDLLLNKSKHAKMARSSSSGPETKTKETNTTPELNVRHISTQTDLLVDNLHPQTPPKPVISDGELNESTPKKSKHKEVKKTPPPSKNKRRDGEIKKNLRKRKISESGSSVASMNIQETMSVEPVEQSFINDSETKKHQKQERQYQEKQQKTKTRQTRNSVHKIEEPVVNDEKCGESTDETKSKNVVPKLKINLLNVKSKMIKYVQNRNDDADEIITKPNNQSDKIEADEDANTNNKITLKGCNKKLRGKKNVDNDVIAATNVSSVEPKEETVLVINTRKRAAKSKKNPGKELIVNLSEDKPIIMEDKKDVKNSELNDKEQGRMNGKEHGRFNDKEPEKFNDKQLEKINDKEQESLNDKQIDILNDHQLESKHEEINGNTEEIQSTKRKSKKEIKMKIEDEPEVDVHKKSVNEKRAPIRKRCERRNSRNRSATPSSSSSITEMLEIKSEAIISAGGKRSRKRKTNTEINDVESKKSKLAKVESERVVTPSSSLKTNSDDEIESLLGFNVDTCKEDVLTKTGVSALTNNSDDVEVQKMETETNVETEINTKTEAITKLETNTKYEAITKSEANAEAEANFKTESEEINSANTDTEITTNDNIQIHDNYDDDGDTSIEVEYKRKQIKHNRRLNKIVTDNVSTDSIDNIYIEDGINVAPDDKLVKTCFVQLERINITLNEEAQNEAESINIDELNCDLVDSALISDENLNDILFEELGNEDIDFNILSEEKGDLVKIQSQLKEIDVIDENGMYCMGHQKSILDIKIVGDEFFAASEDGTIYKYCLKSGTLQDAYTGHKRAVTCIYTINGGFLNIESTLLYSGSLDCTLKCYNIETAEVLHSVTVAQAIQCLDSAWGYIFLGTYEGLLFIYNMKKKILNEHSLTIANATVLMIKATQEGSRQVLILASRKREIMVRDAFTGLLLRTMCEEQKPTIYSLLLDRSMVYCGTSDKGILILDFNNGHQVGNYNSGKGVVCMLMYRSLLFAGCYDGLIYVYNTKTQKHVSTIPGPGEGMLLSLAICKDVIVAGSKKDHLLKIWKIPQEIFNQIE